MSLDLEAARERASDVLDEADDMLTRGPVVVLARDVLALYERVKTLEAENRTLEVSASDYATVLKRSQKRAREAEARVKALEAAARAVVKGYGTNALPERIDALDRVLGVEV